MLCAAAGLAALLVACEPSGEDGVDCDAMAALSVSVTLED